HYRMGALELVCVGPRAGALDPRASRVAPPALVVSAGVCGALAPDLAEGDLVVPETVVARAGAWYATAEVAGLRRAGTLVTVDEVVATPAAKARLWVEAGAFACDMESAVILEWARARGIPAEGGGPAAAGGMRRGMRNGAGPGLVAGHPPGVAAPRPPVE